MSDTVNDNLSAFEFIGDKLNSVKETLDNVKDCLSSAKDVVKEIAAISAEVKVVIGLISALGVFDSGKSEMEALYEAISKQLKALAATMNAGFRIITQQNIDDKKGDASSVYLAVSNYLKAIDKFGEPLSEKSEEVLQLESAVGKSLDSVSDLTQISFWKRTFDEDALCKLKWEHDNYVPDLEGPGEVWDYRLALPALLFAISARILLLKTKESDLADVHKNEIQGYISSLETVYEKMVNGIVKTPAPMPELAGSNNAQFTNSGRWADFDKSACGAVDKYSGSAFIQSLPFDQPLLFIVMPLHSSGIEPKIKISASDYTSPLNIEREPYRRWFYLSFAIRAERMWQQLYDHVGLRELWNNIIALKQLINEPYSELPAEQGYSLRKIMNTNMQMVYPEDGFSNGQSEKMELGLTEPFSLRWLSEFLGKEYVTPKVQMAAANGESFARSTRAMFAGN